MFISEWKLKKYIKQIMESPRDPLVHKNLGDSYVKQRKLIPAIAEYRTSITLDNADVSVFLSLARAYLSIGQRELAVSLIERIQSNLHGGYTRKAARIVTETKTKKFLPLSTFNHNRYFRLKTIADHITNLYGSTAVSVLDMGGGDGALSLFLPFCRYVLADPSVNGLSINDFSEKSFDIVVACHVLEHIPLHKRDRFLVDLASKATDYVILLNPFFQLDGFVEERLKLIIEITNSSWAKEHLDCTLPALDEIKAFAAQYNYKIRIFPNGSLATTLAFIFLDHYANLAGKQHELQKINEFYNINLFNQLNSSYLPTGYLIEIHKGSDDNVRFKSI